MKFWLELFNKTTWAEFIDAGANVSGFPATHRHLHKPVQKGDVFLCYVTVLKRWVGALEVIGPSRDTRHIWKDKEYNLRFAVKPLIVLQAEDGVPMEVLEGKVHFFVNANDRGRFRGFVRSSLAEFKKTEDGHLILSLLTEAKEPRK